MEVELDASKTDDDATITKTAYIFKIKTDEPIERIEKCLKHTMDTCPVGVLFEKAGIVVNSKVILI
jgi:hypothetical protein